MRASKLQFGSAAIPFRTSFGHAAASREQAENVLVYVQDEAGRFGLGEGCPRAYVTGETLESARRFLEQQRAALLAIADLRELQAWIREHRDTVDANPSAFCAAELALLDLFGRQRGETLEQLLELSPALRPLQTTAVYGTGGWLKFRAQRFLFGRNGMRDAKLKLSGDARRDARRAAVLARRGPVRLDANNLWKTAEEAVAGLRRVAAHAWAIEEPVQARDWSGLAEVGARTKLALIADESLTSAADLVGLPPGSTFIPNLRVSKLGGLLRSLSVGRRALAQGRRLIVGAQVGETSILARAGAALAASLQSNLVGFEVGYGVRLLAHDVVTPALGFGAAGELDLARAGLGRSGLGLEPTPAFHAVLGSG